MNETVEIVSLVVSFLLSAFYSGSEAALLSIPLDRLKQIVEHGGSRAKALEFLLEKPHAVLNTLLIGNNLVNTFAASLTAQIAARYFENDALAISVGITTLLILIFGEITPKTFARTHSEKLAEPILKILKANYLVFYPFVKAVTFITTKVLGKNAHLRGKIVTKKDIEYLINRAEQEQSIDSKQIDLLTSILEFPKIKVKDIMISRNKVITVKQDSSFEDIINTVREHGHSRYPVISEDLDHSMGFLHVKDLAFVKKGEASDFTVKRFLKPPFFIYEHMKIQAVFDHMNRRKVHLALVKDENGIVVGIITLEDIMEEIFGDIVDEHDNEEDTIVGQQPDDESKEEGVLVAGSISLRDLDNTYNIIIPLNDNYSTLTGFLLEMLGNIFPKEGQIIIWEGYTFEIQKVENSLIEEVRITSTESASDDEPNETSNENEATPN